ncbi:MAG: hypothetical protein ACYTEX_26315, partial [Planctomycetota bacterium]
TLIIVVLALYFFFLPLIQMVYYLCDPALEAQGMPKFALRLHRRVSPGYEAWARRRVASGQADKLSIDDIAGTEWPVFGSCFYLWATESLQQAWEKDNDLCAVAPRTYAAGAIEAAAALVADPGHATWVKEHWGPDYLQRENVFYRMLLIGGLTSYHKLLGGDKYMSLLRDQVETLSKALDESPYGLLDDYPGQCYPTDVVAAIAAINRADDVLGTDHGDFVKRSVRGFRGPLVDTTGLPPYAADSRSGYIGPARGCSSQWVVLWAPELWPKTAKQWYESFERHFWQEHWTAVGFREFAKETGSPQWYFDVDAGPVAAGFGAAASAFGIGAARANGRFDHAYPLSAELIVMSWPLPDGTLFVPRLLSNKSNAPYLGEAAVLFALTRMPGKEVETTRGTKVPGFVYCALALYLGIGVLAVFASLLGLRRWRKRGCPEPARTKTLQLAVWAALVALAVAFVVADRLVLALLMLMLAQFVPRAKRERTMIRRGGS